MCERFHCDFSQVKSAFRDFKDGHGEALSIRNPLRDLLNGVGTVPVSTAACERGFSKMNLICTSLRSQLSTEHISSLMFISINGPPLAVWQPLPYVQSWLISGKRGASSTSCSERKMATTSNETYLRSLWNIL